MENKRFKNNVILSMLKNNIGIITVLLIIGIVLSFISPVFLTVDNIVSVLRQVSNNIYLALGMTLVIILGGIDLSVGAIVAMCGTLTVGFIVTNGIPIPVAIFLGLLIGTVCGLFNGLVISHFKVPAFIVTLAMMNMAKGIAYIYSGGRSTRITDKGFIAIGSGKLFNFIPLPVVYMIILIIVFTVLLNKTKFGTHIYAVGGNRESIL